MTLRRFFVDTPPVIGEEAILSGQDARHAKTVLRLAPGDKVLLLTGDGREYLAEICSAAGDCIRLMVMSARASSADPGILLTVAIGFLKEKKIDDLIPPLTELGIHHFLPFFAERSVSRPDPQRMASRVERWEKIARESMKQCRRTVAPIISPAVGFDHVLALGKNNHLNILFWEEDKHRSPFPPPPKEFTPPLRILIVLGPEGGITETEAAAAEKAGFTLCPLGPRILKAETAAIAATALAQYIYGDMNTSPDSPA